MNYFKLFLHLYFFMVFLAICVVSELKWKSLKKHFYAVLDTNSDKLKVVKNDLKRTLKERFGDSYHKIADVAEELRETFKDNIPESINQIGTIPSNITKSIQAVSEDVKKTFNEHFGDQVKKFKGVKFDTKKSWKSHFGGNEKLDTLVSVLEKAIETHFGEGSNETHVASENAFIKLKYVVQALEKSALEEFGDDWKSKLEAVRKDFRNSSKNHLGEELRKIWDVPAAVKRNASIKFEAILDDVTNSLIEHFGETFEKAGNVAKDITKPLNWKVDQSLDKIGARLGSNVGRAPEPNSAAFLIVGSSGAILLILCSILFFYFWYRRRYAVMTKNEVITFRRGKGTDGRDGELGLDGRGFPPEFEISRSRIILLKLIGQGNFGLVYKALFSDKEGRGQTRIAVKMSKPECSKASFKSILIELKVLCYVGHHPHVLEFLGAYIEEIGRGIVYIATQLCENGSLQDYLRKLKCQIREANGSDQASSSPNIYELCRYAHEIAMGMEHIASKKIIHGDLSTRNVMLDSNFACKVGDFGLSIKLYEYQMFYERKKGAHPGLPWRWLAIESLRRLEFSTQSDVWSYGVTLWEIYSLGDLPYPGISSSDELLEKLEDVKKGKEEDKMGEVTNQKVEDKMEEVTKEKQEDKMEELTKEKEEDKMEKVEGMNNEKKGPLRLQKPAFSTERIYKQMKRCWDVKPEQRPTFTELSQLFASIAIRDLEYADII